MKEWINSTNNYTGRSITCDITYVLLGKLGLDKDYCILSISNIKQYKIVSMKAKISKASEERSCRCGCTEYNACTG